MDRVAHLAADAAAVRDLIAEGDLDAPVPACPGWGLRDLARHLGQVHRWATAVVQSGEQQQPPPVHPHDSGLAEWFDEGAAQLALTLATCDPEAPCWSFTSDRTAGFWIRRQALETAVHRWDAQSAEGEPDPIDPVLAADGVAEVVDLILPRQLRLGRLAALPAAVTLRCVDTGATCTIGEGVSVAELHAPAELLLLLLWHRIDPGDPRLHVTGDRGAAAEVLRLPLAP